MYGQCHGCVSQCARYYDYSHGYWCGIAPCYLKCLLLRCGQVLHFPPLSTNGAVLVESSMRAWYAFVARATLEQVLAAWYCVPCAIRKEVDDIDRSLLGEKVEAQPR